MSTLRRREFHAKFAVAVFRDPVLFEQFNCKPLSAAAAPDASVPITPGETEEAPKNMTSRVSPSRVLAATKCQAQLNPRC